MSPAVIAFGALLALSDTPVVVPLSELCEGTIVDGAFVVDPDEQLVNLPTRGIWINPVLLQTAQAMCPRPLRHKDIGVRR